LIGVAVVNASCAETVGGGVDVEVDEADEVGVDAPVVVVGVDAPVAADVDGVELSSPPQA
jgi:hypothetical protein